MEVVQGVLIDSTNTIVNEERAKKQGKQENFGVVVLVFVERPNALAIDKHELHGLAILCRFKELGPAPEALSARIDSWAYTETTFISCVDDYAVEKERFTGTVLARHANNANGLIYATKEFASLFTYYILLAHCIKLDHMNGLACRDDLVHL